MKRERERGREGKGRKERRVVKKGRGDERERDDEGWGIFLNNAKFMDTI